MAGDCCTPSSDDPTQVQSAGTPLTRSSSQSQSQSQGSSRLHRPPSSVRSTSTSPSGPPSSSVDTPTVIQYPSTAPDRPTSARSHWSPPQHPHATLQANVSLPPHSHSPHRRHLLRLARAPDDDLYSYHVRMIYAALDVLSVRGEAMAMKGSCKVGELPQSCSAAALYSRHTGRSSCPRHISRLLHLQ